MYGHFERVSIVTMDFFGLVIYKQQLLLVSLHCLVGKNNHHNALFQSTTMTPATTHRQPIETSRVLNVQAAELSSPTQA